MSSGKLNDCVVLLGKDLTPWLCSRFEWSHDTITTIERVRPIGSLDNGGIVVIPGLYNAHTHMGDACWPDGATGLTLEEGFFRPDGFKYRELAKIDPDTHLERLVGHLRYMARTGTVGHFDFREQGRRGAELLRRAAEITGVDSVILSQFNQVPFDQTTLVENAAALPQTAVEELSSILDIADGFSESTMNDLTDEAWRQIRAITDARGKFRAIHCLENTGYREVSLCRTGRGDLVRALELFAPHLVIHLTVANAEEIALLVRSNTTAVINPRANANLGLPLPPVAALLEGGVNLLLGTDNGLLNSPNMFAELDFTYKVAKSQYHDVLHPEPRSILQMATSNMPPGLGSARTGYLDEKAPATFVALNFHEAHLKHTRHLHASIVSRVTPADVLATYRLGRPLYFGEHFPPNS